MEQLFRYIDEQTPRYLLFWKEICMIESPSKDKQGLIQVADLIESFGKETGFLVTRVPNEKSGDCIKVDYIAGPDCETIALLAHMDTVHEKGSFGDVPVREEQGMLYGPGVCDCKGGIAVAFLAMAALKNENCKKNVRLILNPDEESGTYAGQKAVDFIKDSVKGCKAAINCEPSKDGCITVGRKGVIHATIHISGKAAHAGNAYFDGRSAIREAAFKIIELEKMSRVEGITYNCGRICGGTVPNAVPAFCSIDIDVRFNNMQEQNQALTVLKGIAEKNSIEGTTSELAVKTIRPAMECNNEILELFEKLCKTADDCGLNRCFKAIKKGGGSDSAYTVAAGVPTICSLGVEGRFEHTIKEEAVIASLPAQAKLITAVIANL